MCGITGVLGGRDPVGLARRMNACLAHRGPDDDGVSEIVDEGGTVCGALAQRRLAIIDLSPAGHQPMSSPGERYMVVFNGEIYNYRELRGELAAAGETFRSGSDTEVLLLGLARYGWRFVGRLRGMFAFAFWDGPGSRALFGRDPFGIKPLYLSSADGRVAFASESRALLVGGVVGAKISRETIGGYLAWGSVPEPAAMLHQVSAIEAGSVLEVRVVGNRATAPRRIARFNPFEPGETTERPRAIIHDAAEAATLVREALRDSVAHHLIADVPVAVFLSGGIDSSVVCALAASTSATRLESFTVVFQDPRWDEGEFARAVAKRFKTRHHEIPLSADDFYASLDRAFGAMDQPSIDGLNTYVVSRAVRAAGIKVVLSGLGGDELFAGYPSFGRAMRLSRWWPVVRALSLPMRGLNRWSVRSGKLALLGAEGNASVGAYRASRTLFPGNVVRMLTGSVPILPVEPEPFPLSPLQRVTWHELTGYMRNTLLRDSDVFGMASGLELRVPFVDREVVRTSLALDDSLKLKAGMSKPLLVQAMADLLPREVWDRPKRGFTLPFESWMRGPLRGEMEARLLQPSRLERTGLRREAVATVWKNFIDRRQGMTWSRPWALYTLIRWAEQMNVSVTDEVTHPAGTAMHSA